LTKQSAPKELVNAIRQVAGGQRYVSAQLAQVLAAQLGENHELPVHETLSDREYQTLTLIASGKTVSEIARELSLSVKTVSEYRSRLLAKMKLKTSAELTHYAIRNQLID
jgi:DNA-binding NarL/FixJ family response regulator